MIREKIAEESIYRGYKIKYTKLTVKEFKLSKVRTIDFSFLHGLLVQVEEFVFHFIKLDILIKVLSFFLHFQSI